jgi:hypothetical protein
MNSYAATNTTAATAPTRSAAAGKASTVARHLPTAARVLTGLVFFFFGLLGVLAFAGLIPLSGPSTPPPQGAADFTAAMMKTGYLFPMVKLTEFVAGAMLLSNRFVPLALALLAPIVVNIFAFHAFLAPSGVRLAAVVLALEVYLAWTYRGAYRPMLAARASRAGE